MIRRPPRSTRTDTLFPYTTLFRSALLGDQAKGLVCIAAAHPALHPGRSARLELDGKTIGWMGELHPRWAQQCDLAHAPVVFELDASAISATQLPATVELSKQPIEIGRASCRGRGCQEV